MTRGRQAESEARQRLSDDHRSVAEVLNQLQTALKNRDAQTTHSKLDLLWARLAVHIRAEHLHLFPVVMRRLTESPAAEGPDPTEAQTGVDTLRADHDFFMRQLARAIGVLRELTPASASTTVADSLSFVADTVQEIEKRLAIHNEIEESGIYRWASMILSKAEQIQLSARINEELEKRPPRFSLDSWRNEESADSFVL
jgi:hemerythrin-like domain-containing protein